MFRSGPVLPSIIAGLVALLAAAIAHAQAAPIPAYFFKQWTVASNCIEQGFDAAEQTQVGLQFAVSSTSRASDGLSYTFHAIDNAGQSWPRGWQTLTLQYRPGAPMTRVPADFACIPGQPSSSALLAMSHYTQSAEPYYEYEHWYGLGLLHGEPHHFLIFPRNVVGTDSAIIILLDAGANADATIKLDQDGSIHGDNH